MRWSIDEVTLARAAQRAEVEFVGAPVGIMDQMACSIADEGSALFLDTRDLHYEHVPIPDNVVIVVIHSGVSHRMSAGGYAERRQQCDGPPRCSASARCATPGEDMPGPSACRSRCPAVCATSIAENARVVLDTVAALRARDLVAAGRLFVESHASLRDDYAFPFRKSTASSTSPAMAGCVRRPHDRRRFRRVDCRAGRAGGGRPLRRGDSRGVRSVDRRARPCDRPRLIHPCGTFVEVVA